MKIAGITFLLIDGAIGHPIHLHTKWIQQTDAYRVFGYCIKRKKNNRNIVFESAAASDKWVMGRHINTALEVKYLYLSIIIRKKKIE